MKLSPINLQTSFKATVHSNRYRGDWLPTHRFKDGLTKQEVADCYDAHMGVIERQKRVALELQDYMNSEEIQEILNKLPEEDTVEIRSLLTTHNTVYGKNPIEPDDIELRYDPSPNDTIRRRQLDNVYLRSISVQKDDEERSLDKEKIANWLNTIADFFSFANK